MTKAEEKHLEPVMPALEMWRGKIGWTVCDGYEPFLIFFCVFCVPYCKHVYPTPLPPTHTHTQLHRKKEIHVPSSV